MSGSAVPLRRRAWIALLVIVIVAASVFVGLAVLYGAEALQNPGFEQMLEGWTASGPAGNWAVVEVETPEMYPTYAKMGGVTVEPASGEKMLRIGIPQTRDKHQAKGLTKVEQTFMAVDTDRLAVCFRLFSWEHREGRDALTIDIKNLLGQSVGTLEEPVTVDLPSGRDLHAGDLPYTLGLDIGADEYLDSGWVKVLIKDIPANEVLTLSYALNTDRDAAHDSWVYIDWWNSPPEARFEFSPDEPHEGDPIGMFGQYSSDPDEAFGDSIVAWDWTLTRLSDGAEEVRDGEELLWIPPNQGDFHVELSVMDTFGAVGTTETVIPVESFAPIVNAVNAEIFAGEPMPLFGRTLDQGWLDEHIASWSFVGAPGSAGAITEDHQAALSSGIVTGSTTVNTAAGTRIEGELQVSDVDDSNSVGTDVVALSVVEADPDRHEPNDSFADLDALPQLPSDWSYLSYIQAPGDIDLYEIKLPDGDDLPAGTDVLVTLDELSADYDLVLLATVPA